MTGILWKGSDPNNSFVMSISEPYHSGWYDVVIEVKGDVKSAIKSAELILKENDYYRPRDNWLWKTTNTTYMKKNTTYHQTKVRLAAPSKDDEEE